MTVKVIISQLLLEALSTQNVKTIWEKSPNCTLITPSIKVELKIRNIQNVIRPLENSQTIAS